MPTNEPHLSPDTPTYTVERLVLGHFRMDGGGLFGIVPKKLWQRMMPADDDNRVTLAALALLVRGNGITMVIDAGLGDKLDEKQRKIFAVEQPENSLRDQLAQRGIAPKDVTHFIYTHLHFDHAGGATELRDGKLQPVFPSARHYVSKSQLEWATAPSAKDKASFQRANWQPVQEAGLLEILDVKDTELEPSIKLPTFNGHTPGMICPIIQTARGAVFFAVDLFPTQAHLPPHYVAAFDNEPLLAMEEKLGMAKWVAENKCTMIPGHDAECAEFKVLLEEGRAQSRSSDGI